MVNNEKLKILLLDIETAPNVVYTWGLWDQNVSLNQIISDGYMLSWSAKWFNKKEIMSDCLINYKNNFQKNPKDDSLIAKTIWTLMDEADIIIGHNSDGFDIKWLNSVFLKNNMKPVSSFKSIDTLKVVRDNFRFLSNKLEYLAKKLTINEKIKNEGFELWVKCMKGDSKAWDDMLKYNKKDVLILEDIYKKIRPFMKNHPNLSLYNDKTEMVCPVCEHTKFKSKGFAYTSTGRYNRYVCCNCGKNVKGRKNILPKEKLKNLYNNIT